MWCLPDDRSKAVITAAEQVHCGGHECRMNLPETAIVFFMSKGTEYLAARYDAVELPEPFPRFLNRCPIWEIPEWKLCFLDGGRGAPQAADTVETLAALGVRNIIAVGMCGAFDDKLRVGEIIAPEKAFVEEGTSLHYYESIRASAPDEDLLDMAVNLFPVNTEPIVSTDSVYRQTFRKEQVWREEGAVGVDMETSAVFSISRCLGLRAAALLMVSAFADSPMRVSLRGDTVSRPFVEMTLGIMSQFGMKANFENGAYSAAFVPSAGAERVYNVEPDATAASYFIALPAAVGGACEIKNFADCRLQGDAAFCGLLSKAGLVDSFAVGDSLVVESAGRRDFPESLEFDFNDISDTFLTLAAISPLLPFKLSIRGIAHTRAQETDRVAACAAQLRKFCAKVEETEDSISITPHPPERLAEIAQTPTLVNTYADHRIAMSFSILASRDVRGDGRPWIIIEDPGCVSKTWAEFFEVLYTARSDSGALRVVAVDGGAAVGKSSVSKECARILGYMHVDTGAHYRTVAYALLGEGISPDDPAVVAERLKSVKLGTALCGNSARATLDGKLVDDALIRTERVNSEVAKFAAIAEVREFLKSYQRSMADFARSRGFAGLIMEGRDIGSVIFPDADVRIFLDADEQTRAARRAREGIADSIGLRDAMDRSRKTAPLRCPESAERIDTSNMTKDEVVRLTLSLILES